MGIFVARKKVFMTLLIMATISACLYILVYDFHIGDGLIQSIPEQKIHEYTPEEIKRIGATLDHRLHLLEEVCKDLWLESNISVLYPRDFQHLIVDDKHKLIYCYIPKVACTNWKRVMLILTGHSNQLPLNIPANMTHSTQMFRLLSNYTVHEIRYRIKNYMKFLFVRHPFERLVSAYRNKFVQEYSTYFQNRFGRLIVEQYRKNPSNESLRRGHDVTFDEFVQYVTDPNTFKSGPLNEHWRPMVELCHPCRLHYDFIGKYETLEADAEYILRRAAVQNMVRFPSMAGKSYNTSELVESYLSNMTTSQLFPLYQLYALDFRLFGYHHAEYDHYLPK